MNPSPIALFVYNRLWHTQQTVEALRRNQFASESELFIFSDGYKDGADMAKVTEVREYIKSINGFKNITIIEKDRNFGLANSITSGVSEIVNKFGRVIVLEDDLVTSPYFLKYTNEALDLYENEDEVISIHGYVYPVKKSLPETFFIKGANCWGWATWKRGWDIFESDGVKLLKEIEEKDLSKEFDFDSSYNYTDMLRGQINGKNDSWAVRWYASAFIRNKLTLYSGRSLVKNIGMDNTGRHSGATSIFYQNLAATPISIHKITATENKLARKEFIGFFKSIKPNLTKRILKKIKKIINLR